MKTIRLAQRRDIEAISGIYDRIHDEIEAGNLQIDWFRGIYPTRETAQSGFERGDLFVIADDTGEILGSAIINQVQETFYDRAGWLYESESKEVMVLHTLTVEPAAQGRGCGERFVRFYEDYAGENGCKTLRMDTDEKNLAARGLYRKMGYREADILTCTIDGVPGLRIVLLEKRI